MSYTAFYEKNAPESAIIIDSDVTLDENSVTHSPAAATLEVLHGHAQARTIILCVSACTIGRNAIHPLHIPDQRVSGTHAVILHQEGGFWLKDSGSRNGTFLNGEACLELTPIFSGDTIRLGQSVTLHIR